MLIAGRSFTEPAGLLPSSLPRMTLPRCVVVGAGQAHAGAPAACGRWRPRSVGIARCAVAHRDCQARRGASSVGIEPMHIIRGRDLESPRAPISPPRPGGEIGRRRGLKIAAPQGRAGSIPASGHQRHATHAAAAPRHAGPAADQRRACSSSAACSAAASSRPFALWPLGSGLPAVAGRHLRVPARQLRAPVLQHARPVDVRLRARATSGARSASCSSMPRACWPPR